MNRSATGLLLSLAALSLAFAGVAGLSLFGPQTFTADDNGKGVTVNSGETFWLRLPENPTTGYAWDFQLSDGLTKLVVDPVDDRVLGVGIAGVGAGEMIAEGVLAIEMGARAQDLTLTIHAHPTLSETVMEAAEAVDGHSPHLAPRR